MPETSIVKKIYKWKPFAGRPVGRPKSRWEDDVRNDSSSSLPVGRWPVYSSTSLHLFVGRPRFLFPSGIPSRTFFTSRSSAILDMCSFHSVLLLCTHDVMFWISHDSRILPFLILSHFVLFVILLNVFISVTSNICVVFAVSVRVSAA
jgi:hypothetical protein